MASFMVRNFYVAKSQVDVCFSMPIWKDVYGNRYRKKQERVSTVKVILIIVIMIPFMQTLFWYSGRSVLIKGCVSKLRLGEFAVVRTCSSVGRASFVTVTVVADHFLLWGHYHCHHHGYYYHFYLFPEFTFLYTHLRPFIIFSFSLSIRLLHSLTPSLIPNSGTNPKVPQED